MTEAEQEVAALDARLANPKPIIRIKVTVSKREYNFQQDDIRFLLCLRYCQEHMMNTVIPAARTPTGQVADDLLAIYINEHEQGLVNYVKEQLHRSERFVHTFNDFAGIILSIHFMQVEHVSLWCIHVYWVDKADAAIFTREYNTRFRPTLWRKIRHKWPFTAINRILNAEEYLKSFDAHAYIPGVPRHHVEDVKVRLTPRLAFFVINHKLLSLLITGGIALLWFGITNPDKFLKAWEAIVRLVS